MALKAAASALKRIVSNVEVERKFNPGPKFTSLFANHTSHASHREKTPFAVRSHPGQLIRDTYYDTEDGHLGELGMWVRKRSVDVLPLNPARLTARANDGALWNAKLRLGGHFSNSLFVEFDGQSDVSREVLRITGAKTSLEDLRVVSDLQTRRSEWEVTQLADSTAPSAKMTIVVDAVTEAEAETEVGKYGIDEAAFNHLIGEVELFQEFVTEGKDDTEHEAHRKEIAAQRMKELEEFMLSHPDLFSTSPSPVGKLSAYETWKAKRT
ncbi:hypothetical protein F4781DRAFT_425369 [Annulohypoxylon bovei var. microspora]|nr:hypothetical protein F4781DRAFT_425369 [Annulohypoxylon bovei var. microspora]